MLIPRPKPVSTISAPCSWHACAAANAIDCGVRTPVISRRFFSSSTPSSLRRGPGIEAPVAASTTSHVTCPSSSVCFTLIVSGCRVRHRSRALELVARLGLDVVGAVDRDAGGLELRVQLVRDLRLEPAGVERLAARDRDDGDGEQDGGANEPERMDAGVLLGRMRIEGSHARRAGQPGPLLRQPSRRTPSGRPTCRPGRSGRTRSCWSGRPRAGRRGSSSSRGPVQSPSGPASTVARATQLT